jgi:predicted metalloprotease with PDZ domain
MVLYFRQILAVRSKLISGEQFAQKLARQKAEAYAWVVEKSVVHKLKLNFIYTG